MLFPSALLVFLDFGCGRKKKGGKGGSKQPPKLKQGKSLAGLCPFTGEEIDSRNFRLISGSGLSMGRDTRQCAVPAVRAPL